MRLKMTRYQRWIENHNRIAIKKLVRINEITKQEFICEDGKIVRIERGANNG